MDITALNAGAITGEFYSYSADFTDYVRVIDVTQNWTSAWLLPNHGSKFGDMVTFGTAQANDVLVVEIFDQNTNHIFASDPSMSDDLTNHAYVVGGNFFGKPSAYLGMEDLQATEGGDWDYNDHQFFLFNVTVSPGMDIHNFGTNVATPEPTTMVLLGSGLLAAFRKVRKSRG